MKSAPLEYLPNVYIYTLPFFPLCGPLILIAFIYYYFKKKNSNGFLYIYSFPCFHHNLVNLSIKIPRREKSKSQFVLSLKFIVLLWPLSWIYLHAVVGFPFQITEKIWFESKKTSCWIESYVSTLFSEHELYIRLMAHTILCTRSKQLILGDWIICITNIFCAMQFRGSWS
jgi:hypothetical protein